MRHEDVNALCVKERRQVAIEHMRSMEQEMKIAQDQISARREEQERSIQSVKR